MHLILDKESSVEQAKQLVRRLEWMGLRAYAHRQRGQPAVTVVPGNTQQLDVEAFQQLPGVQQVLPSDKAYRLASLEGRGESLPLQIGSVQVGGGELAVMAGPCAIESRNQIRACAACVKECGGNILRGGAFKPRTSPYAFQGLGEEGLSYLQEAGKDYDLLTVTEVLDSESIPLLERYVDIAQVGARNMQNFSLLKALGRSRLPVLLKRGMACTYQDLLMAAEYILSGGNEQVLLCERGIRTFETHTRNTLDIAAVPNLQEMTHLPVIVDPSHGTGRRSMVTPMARAAIAAGADGIMVEIHPDPDRALSDGMQSLYFEQFAELMKSVRVIANACHLNRTLEKKEEASYG